MPRPILKFAVALLILTAVVLFWCNWREILDWVCETLRIYELIEALKFTGCFDPDPLKL